MRIFMKKHVNMIVTYIMLFLFMVCIAGCSKTPQTNIYSDNNNWAYAEIDVQGKDADVFFICPTVYAGDENIFKR